MNTSEHTKKIQKTLIQKKTYVNLFSNYSSSPYAFDECKSLDLKIHIDIETLEISYYCSELYVLICSSTHDDNYLKNTRYFGIVEYDPTHNKFLIPKKYLKLFEQPFSDYFNGKNYHCIVYEIVEYLRSLFFWNVFEIPNECIKLIQDNLQYFYDYAIHYFHCQNEYINNIIDVIFFVKNFSNNKYRFKSSVFGLLSNCIYFSKVGIKICRAYN